jgi:hypothetical protein
MDKADARPGALGCRGRQSRTGTDQPEQRAAIDRQLLPPKRKLARIP